MAQAERTREAELQARWRAGAWQGWTLRATDGARYTLVYQGRPGGPAGPDFRDAVLRDARGEQLLGDIELHLSPAGWRAHGHQSDPRYNELALHVTLTAGRHAATTSGLLASGRQVPLVVLTEQVAPLDDPPRRWPCAAFAAGAPAARLALLRAQGWARFDERVDAFAAALRTAPRPTTAPPGWSAVDVTLLPALAEALAYGRDRATLRAVGERLAAGAAPDALLTTAARSGAIERRRIVGLLALLGRWQMRSPCAQLTTALRTGADRAGPAGAARALTEALVVAERGAVSPGRARIVAFNVVLPCVVAGSDGPMATLAREVVAALPGLPTNQITREVSRQLGLPRPPRGALAQQGLHHVWARTCREKRCDRCPCAAAV